MTWLCMSAFWCTSLLGSRPKAIALVFAIANKPQSLPPICLCIETIYWCCSRCSETGSVLLQLMSAWSKEEKQNHKQGPLLKGCHVEPLIGAEGDIRNSYKVPFKITVFLENPVKVNILNYTMDLCRRWEGLMGLQCHLKDLLSHVLWYETVPVSFFQMLLYSSSPSPLPYVQVARLLQCQCGRVLLYSSEGRRVREGEDLAQMNTQTLYVTARVRLCSCAVHVRKCTE